MGLLTEAESAEMLAELMRVGRYGIVGAVATATQIGVAEFFLLVAGASPLLANFCGFLVAVVVSFTGHHVVTFQRQRRSRDAFPRFAAIAVSAFIINSLVLSLLVGARLLPSYLAIVVAIGIIPVASYLLMRSWAFRAAG